LIISAYYFGFLVASFTTGLSLNKIGRKNYIKYGIVIMAVTTATFALGYYVKNDGFFMALSILSRLMQGVADAMVCTAIPAIITIEWPANAEKYMGYFGMALGIGLILGPVFATVLDKQFGYAGCFFFFAGFILISGMVTVATLPDRLNDSEEIQ